MTKLRIRGFGYLAGLGLALVTWPAAGTEADPPSFLQPETRHERVGEIVAQFIQQSHYNQVAVDDELSSLVLDRFIESVDRNRLYLLDGDVEYFDSFRHELDDMVRSDPLDPVFEAFQIYQTRARERLEFALRQLETEPDFTVDEEYRFDRTEAPWAKSSSELDDIWRRRIKNDALNLALEGEPWEKIRETLTRRYTGYMRRLNQVNSDDVFERFMNAFVNTLDPHSNYYSPRNTEEYRIQMSLSYFGIGASLQTEDDFVKIAGIIPGGPAAIDGTLKPEDRITGVAQGADGEIVDVIGWRLDDVVQLIRGPADSVVRLEIIPANSMPGSPKKFIDLTRGQVKLEEQAAKSEIVRIPREGREWSVGVIDVPSFYRDYPAQSRGDKSFTSTTKDVRRLIGELEQEGIDGLVIDLRGNGGGHLTEATALSGLFIDNGPVVQLRNSNGRISRLDDPDPVARVAYNGPLVVLVDRYSASASEIFAAAIQDYARGVIVGQQTFGKGTVQNLYPLDQYLRGEDDKGFGQLTLTIGKYYRVTGESTQHRGVDPDIALPSHINAGIIGESVRDRALPWDTIQTTRFRAGKPLDSTIESLAVTYMERAGDDPNYLYQLDTIRAAEEMPSRKSVSLNIDSRRAEREHDLQARLDRENERRAALDLEPLASFEDIGDDEFPDILLDQAADIVTDLATLRETGGPPQTARVR
ncbi:MAG: carboxy terminal-processing peptidase [Proteobacteria bacterium]|nr:carboxy terminal-processing peptidase [Pseudomonadota bacterium]